MTAGAVVASELRRRRDGAQPVWAGATNPALTPEVKLNRIVVELRAQQEQSPDMVRAALWREGLGVEQTRDHWQLGHVVFSADGPVIAQRRSPVDDPWRWELYATREQFDEWLHATDWAGDEHWAPEWE